MLEQTIGKCHSVPGALGSSMHLTVSNAHFASPSVAGDEHIAALDISMDDPQLVHVLQSHAELSEPVLHLAHGQLQMMPSRAKNFT